MNAAGALYAVGCYTPTTGGRGRGVYIVARTPSGGLSVVSDLAMPSPSCVIAHPRRRVLYCANEINNGHLSALRITPDARLSLISQHQTGGSLPCHLAITTNGRFLLSADYGGGTISAFRLSKDGNVIERCSVTTHSGSGPVPGRQDGPHVHMIVEHPRTKAIYAVDLGTDAVCHYLVDATGQLQEIGVSRLRAGTGPRQIVFTPGGEQAYIVGELSGELLRARVLHGGSLRVEVTVPATRRSSTTLPAHLALDSRRQRLVLSDRGPDTIAVFATAGNGPRLENEYSSGGQWPRQFAILANRLLVANQNSDLVTSFAVDSDLGLVPEGELAIGTPTWVEPLPW